MNWPGRPFLYTDQPENTNFVENVEILLPAKFRWLVVLSINVDLAIFQPYLDLEAGDNQSLKIQVVRPGIEPRYSCSASQELNHSATAAPAKFRWIPFSGLREVENVSANERPGWPSCFSDRP